MLNYWSTGVFVHVVLRMIILCPLSRLVVGMVQMEISPLSPKDIHFLLLFLYCCLAFESQIVGGVINGIYQVLMNLCMLARSENKAPMLHKPFYAPFLFLIFAVVNFYAPFYLRVGSSIFST